MYFLYAPFCLSAVKTNLNDSEQGTVLHEFREYYDPSGALTFASTHIQVIDLPICPRLLQFVPMHTFTITGARGSSFSFTSANAAFAEYVYDDIYERVRPLSLTGLASDSFRPSAY
jgi:hypothetical protein